MISKKLSFSANISLKCFKIFKIIISHYLFPQQRIPAAKISKAHQITRLH